MINQFKFSGHETFHCRHFWLKKGVDQKNSKNMLGYHLTNSEFLFYSGRYEEALRDLQEARRIARNNFKIREIITERILILQTYVAPQRRRS